jgi:16S rRNA (cytosine1402-N4)-methyltransferase
LRAFLDQIDTLLRPGGRCAIMSFHSVEDRIIKNAYKNLVDTGSYTLVNKKVIAPSWQEVKINKASRSAKLRVIEKVGT